MLEAEYARHMSFEDRINMMRAMLRKLRSGTVPVGDIQDFCMVLMDLNDSLSITWRELPNGGNCLMAGTA